MPQLNNINLQENILLIILFRMTMEGISFIKKKFYNIDTWS